jgi:Raf kinase inhibitor-like YbhB/YbcL family protein
MVAALALTACAGSKDEALGDSAAKISLTSAVMADGVIPGRYACFEASAGPALAWSAPPDATKSLAIIARDLDSTLSSVLGPFVHWLVYDIPAGDRELPDALPAQAQLTNGTRQGINGFDKVGFAGPCPPGKSWHRYEFRVYALDTTLDLASVATHAALLSAMKGHVIATGSLIGRYKR